MDPRTIMGYPGTHGHECLDFISQTLDIPGQFWHAWTWTVGQVLNIPRTVVKHSNAHGYGHLDIASVARITTVYPGIVLIHMH